ncbi:uncharacterized protein UV8b_00009 [Ustilaginoidea virens]|uniref:Uncharacterized protein n=1 Tax=Ustilaginoidea virens TaxID=1159556 RepID=A0A8E5MD81_USTVR|nr:uncharacterized protein UV8b_00009 [Ustilaginoidea virens]QUC15768.1 hypothetical protein UV8b_00009 [Ustilaginoidea virens]
MRPINALGLALLPIAAARKHSSCDCGTETLRGKHYEYDWLLTYNVCVYSYPRSAEYDFQTGRCEAVDLMSGDRFHGDCEYFGKNGYFPVSPSDNITLDENLPRLYHIHKDRKVGSRCR